jgi:hypothetical protein
MSYEDHVHYRERERHGRAMAELAQVRTFAAGARSLHRSIAGRAALHGSADVLPSAK